MPKISKQNKIQYTEYGTKFCHKHPMRVAIGKILNETCDKAVDACEECYERAFKIYRKYVKDKP